MKRLAAGDTGTVRVGITPPVAPVLASRLCAACAAEAFQATVSLERMWLPALTDAVSTAAVDVRISCGVIPPTDGVVSTVFCAEPLVVGLRPDHRLAGQESVNLADPAHDVLGSTRENLYPAWALSRRQALEATDIQPPSVDLEDTDLYAARWLDQPAADWILLISSLTSPHCTTVIKPVEPALPVPFTVLWMPDRARSRAVGRFVHAALTADPPPGWLTQPGHLHH